MNPVHGSPQGLAVAAADDPVFFTTPKPEAVEYSSYASLSNRETRKGRAWRLGGLKYMALTSFAFFEASALRRSSGRMPGAAWRPETPAPWAAGPAGEGPNVP